MGLGIREVVGFTHGADEFGVTTENFVQELIAVDDLLLR